MAVISGRIRKNSTRLGENLSFEPWLKQGEVESVLGPLLRGRAGPLRSLKEEFGRIPLRHLAYPCHGRHLRKNSEEFNKAG